MSNAPMFLMLKRDLYECPKHCGYTGIKDNAGRYTLDEVATSIGPDKYTPLMEEHYFIKEEDGPQYTHKCYWDVREAHLKDKLEALTAERDAQAKRIEELEAAQARQLIETVPHGVDVSRGAVATSISWLEDTLGGEVPALQLYYLLARISELEEDLGGASDHILDRDEIEGR